MPTLTQFVNNLYQSIYASYIVLEYIFYKRDPEPAHLLTHDNILLLIEVIRITILRNNFSRCLFYILHLHVLALVGHLRAEYTIILGSYFTQN
jgi:uncharacterized membrane protein